jgi:hypothetical protein
MVIVKNTNGKVSDNEYNVYNLTHVKLKGRFIYYMVLSFVQFLEENNKDFRRK